MKQALFVTGSDTEIGKTVASSLLLAAMMNDKKSHWNPGYFKPIQAGQDDDDTTTVRQLTGLETSRLLDPVYALKAPMSPDRAAALEKIAIETEKIEKTWRESAGGTWVIEGAGGVEVPLNTREKMGDLIRLFDVAAVVVSSTRLGTINHTLLTIDSLKRRGVEVKALVLMGKADPGLVQCFENYLKIDSIIEIPQLEKVDKDTICSLASEYFTPATLKQLFQTKPPTRPPGHIWHPFTQHAFKLQEHVVQSALGAKLKLENGKELIDAISSWWVNLHGHAHPDIAQAIAAQAGQLEHVIFSGFTHQKAEELSQKLASSFVQNERHFSKVFYSDNGSTAVEVALKMAYQAHINRGKTGKKRFLALKGSYHGDTLGAMSVSDPEGYHKVFNPLMTPVDFIEVGEIDQLKNLLAKNPGAYAAMIVEPMIQGAAGMKRHSPNFLREIYQMCRDNDIFFICDEVFTGFYRTGKMFAFEHAGITPDFVCLSKGITGGFLPLAATLATQDVYESFLGSDLNSAFLHGHSYSGNPIACAAALASFKILESPACQKRIKEIAMLSGRRIEKLKAHPEVESAHSFGTIGAVTLRFGKDYFTGLFAKQIKQMAFDKGVLLRPLGPVVYTVPPYCISDMELHRVFDCIEEIIDEWPK